MKLNGKKVEPRGPTFIAFPRDSAADPDAPPLVFYMTGIRDYAEFEALVPEPPLPKGKYTVEKGYEPDLNAPEYKEALRHREALRWQYMVIKTLEPSGFEWERVKLDDPTTWHHVKEELKEVLTVNEEGHLLARINEANSLSRKALEDAQVNFLQTLRLQQSANENGPKAGAVGTLSGKPANDLE